MFNRNRDQGAPQGRSSGFDEVLAELESRHRDASPAAKERLDEDAPEEATDADEPGSSTDTQETDGTDAAPPRSGGARVTEHADTLRAAREAQERAHEMLTMAATARDDASTQAEQILLEAVSAAEEVRAEATSEAESVRAEAVTWVKAQRDRVTSMTAQMQREAERDVEHIRTEAMRSAMADAEQTARVYAKEANARGHRDAAEIRGKARETLHHTAALGEDLQASMSDIDRTLDLVMESVRDQLSAVESLLAEVRQDESATSPTDDVTPAPESASGASDSAREPADRADADPVRADVWDVVEDDDLPRPLGSSQLGALFRDLHRNDS